jgi:hypothetical protein
MIKMPPASRQVDNITRIPTDVPVDTRSQCNIVEKAAVEIELSSQWP